MAKQKPPSAHVERTTISTPNGSKFSIYELPTFCPRCRKNTVPTILGSTAIDVFDDGVVEIRANVPIKCCGCNAAFIAEYYGEPRATPFEEDDHSLAFIGTIPFAEPKTVVSDSLAKISPLFAKVFDEAVAAQAAALEDLSGAGYRRALEFLVKDYLIHCDPERKEDYIGMALGVCIRDHFKIPEIATLAKEALDSENDFVHFQKYTNREVRDLRRLIVLIFRWIELHEQIQIERDRIASQKVKTP